jgi:UDP-2-acetamido-3-amino-2,3-dideoxy-glucuronate N-acetyltransferase
MLMFAGFPEAVTATGGAYLQPAVYDTTVTNLLFPGGVRGHIYVSWLHPYKDHKLILIGSRKMLVFDDLEHEEKIRLYDKGVAPEDVTSIRSNGYESVPFEAAEPLRVECEHFIECVATRRRPETDASSGVNVLRVLEAAQESLDGDGLPIPIPTGTTIRQPG